MTPELAAEGVAFAYVPNQPVLTDVHLEVAPNDFLCVVGRTGSGKSTLAKLLAGIHAPLRGRVRHRGRDLAGAAGAVAFVFQQDSTLPWRTLVRNVEIALEVGARPLPPAERRARAGALLAQVGLEDYAEYRPAEVSGGMRQRVALARAFATRAPVLVLDEPFGALDVQTAYQLEQQLLALWEADRRTVVFITNAHEQALVLGSAVVALRGDPATLTEQIDVPLERPRDRLDQRVLALRREVQALTTG